jgi:hypothetical protein
MVGRSYGLGMAADGVETIPLLLNPHEFTDSRNESMGRWLYSLLAAEPFLLYQARVVRKHDSSRLLTYGDFGASPYRA